MRVDIAMIQPSIKSPFVYLEELYHRSGYLVKMYQTRPAPRIARVINKTMAEIAISETMPKGIVIVIWLTY